MPGYAREKIKSDSLAILQTEIDVATEQIRVKEQSTEDRSSCDKANLTKIKNQRAKKIVKSALETVAEIHGNETRNEKKAVFTGLLEQYSVSISREARAELIVRFNNMLL